MLRLTRKARERNGFIGHSAGLAKGLREGAFGYHRHAMKQAVQPNARAREKQASRDSDLRALASRSKSQSQIRRENEVFAPLAAKAKPNLRASRSLG